MDNLQMTGSVLLALSSLMGVYYLATRIREELAEKPDPKLTYATKAELAALRESLEEGLREGTAGHRALEERSEASLARAHDLIRRNAEHIAVLIAQAEMFERRISEASRRIDRLGERFVGRQ